MLNLKLNTDFQNKEFFTIADIVKIVGVGKKTAYKWVRSGTLPVIAHGNSFAILRKSVLNLLENINNGKVRLIRGPVPKGKS